MNRNSIAQFIFHSPTRFVVGQGRRAEIGAIARPMGRRAFLAHSATMEREGEVERLCDTLRHEGLETIRYCPPAGEPETGAVDAAAAQARADNCDLVLSLGGGSIIDLAKAVAGLVTNEGEVRDYLEGVGDGRTPNAPALPHIALPTTAGTGAEATRNAVISSRAEGFKKSFRSPTLYPAVAILDAELTIKLPPQQTAFSGMDAITQLIESYLSCRATPMTDALALRGMELAFPAIRSVMEDGADIENRERLLLASAISGICLANAGLGLAHGFASGLGAIYDIPHGKVCAILLPFTLRFNRCAYFPKMLEIARRLLPDADATPEDHVSAAIEEIERMNSDFGIPANLHELAIGDEDIARIIEKSMGNSMSGNPVPITAGIAEMLLKTMR